MKTFKKLFAGITAIMMVISMVPTMDLNAQYADEVVNAYNFAAEATPIAITTTTLEKFKPFNMMTRIQAASFMARALKDFAPDLEVLADADCSFLDVSAAIYNTEMAANVQYVCERGVFGYGMGDYFRSEETTTRAHMVTALMRAVDRDYANNTSPYYYSASMEWMKANINLSNTTPTYQEARRTMVEMIRRLYEAGHFEAGTDYCDSLEVQIECFLGNCPAECSDVGPVECPVGEVFNDTTGACEAIVCASDEVYNEVSGACEAIVSAGELMVSLTSSQPTKEVPTDVYAVAIANVDFAAGSSEDVMLDSIEVEALGYGDYNAIDEIAIYDDRGLKVSRERDMNSDGEAKISFINGYTLKAGSTATLTFTAKITRSFGGTNDVTNGDTFGFNIVAVNGPTLVDGIALSTQTVNVVTVSNMGIYEAEVDLVDAPVKVGESDSLIGSFKLKNENKEENLYVKSVKLEQIGSIDEEFITELSIFADGIKVTDENILWDKDEVTIAFVDGGYLLSEDFSSFVEFDVRATIVGDPGRSVGFQIAEESDLVVIGDNHGFRTTEVGTEVFAMVLSDIATLLVEGADIIADFDKSDFDAVVTEKDGFVFGTLELHSIDTDYMLNDYEVRLTVTQTDGGSQYTGLATATADLAAAGITDVELGGDSFDTVTSAAGLTGDETVFTLTFKDIAINGGAYTNLLLTVDFDDATMDETHKFNLDLNNNSFELEDLDNDEKYTLVNDVKDIFSTTTFSTRLITVEAGSLTVDATKVTGQDMVISNDTEFTIGLGKFIATDSEDIVVKKLKVTATTSTLVDANTGALTLEDVTANVKMNVNGVMIDGDVVADVITFDDDFAVNAGDVVDYTITLYMKDKNLQDNLGELDFDITEVTYRAGTADDTVVTYIADELELVTSEFVIIENGNITISMDTTEDDESVYTQFTDVSKHVIAGTEGVTIAKIKLNADKENMKIKDLYFELALDAFSGALENLKDSISNITLVTANDTYVGILDFDTDANGSADELIAKFESINYVVDDANLEYAYLKADFNAIDESSSAITSTYAGVDVIATIVETNAVDATDQYEIDVIGVESDEDDLTEVLNRGATLDSNTTTVVANVPTAISLTSANTSILAAGTYPIAYLEVTMDAQDVNKDIDNEVYDALLTNLNVDFSFSAGVATTYTIEKVGGVEAAVALTDLGNDDVSGLLDDAEITAGTIFVIKAVVTNAGTREDGAIIQIRLADITADVTLDDGTGNASLMTVPAGTNKDVSVDNEG